MGVRSPATGLSRLSYRDRQLAQDRRAARQSGLKLDGSPRCRTGPVPRQPEEQAVRQVVLLPPDLDREVRTAAALAGESVSAWLRTAAILRLAGATR